MEKQILHLRPFIVIIITGLLSQTTLSYNPKNQNSNTHQTLDFESLSNSQKFKTFDIPVNKHQQTGFIHDISDPNSKKYHKLFYIFSPCLYEPENKPVIFWSMGGPGASILAFYFLLGGPIRQSNSMGWKANPWSWNQFANIVMLDYPYGTGYSYRTKSSVKIKQARYKHMNRMPKRWNKFVESWFQKHPEYLAKNDFYYAGDSSSADFLPSAVNYAHNEKNRKIFSRLQGIIQEAPMFDPIYNLFEMPYTLRMFHELTKKRQFQVLKKNKAWMKYFLNGLDFLPFFHSIETHWNKLDKRYPGKYADYYDFRHIIPYTTPKTHNLEVIPGLLIYKSIYKGKVWKESQNSNKS